jgi:hypothetical protein
MLRAAFIILFIALLPAHVRAETRIALLIGNQAYHPSVGVLKNPYNDIAVVGQALSRQGFEVLPPIMDAKSTAILGANAISCGGLMLPAPVPLASSTIRVTVPRRRTPTSTS